MRVLSGRIAGVAGVQTVGLLALIVLAGGCQSGQATVSNRALIQHQALVNFTGLTSTQVVEPVKVTCSLPRQWKKLPLQETALFTHQQWKAPSSASGAGVVYVHMPLPLSAKTLLWFAKAEYSKKEQGGRAIGEWTDELGRPWFEAENNKYHVWGYAVTEGFSAWIVYYGYKTKMPPNPSELRLAAQAVDTVIPFTGDKAPSDVKVASAGK